MKYFNPVIPGFHPDPSICRVGDDFYLVNSSFEYFPGIPVFHSKNLVQWEQIGHCITRNEQLTLVPGNPNHSGTYAPTIRYHDGYFYVICTNVIPTETCNIKENFIVRTRDPYGEWSQPVFLDCPGIDPSLYFDEDGRVYYCGAYQGIYLYEIDIHTGKAKSEIKHIWQGSGGNCPEGPHIYRINGWYYLMIAEGGTEYGHMVTVARSRDIWGPYESCPRNPIMTNRSLRTSLHAIGHADIVEDQNGNWWAVCLGTRSISYPCKHNLGRETLLAPMTWDSEGWPVMGNQGRVESVFETECLPLTQEQLPIAQTDACDRMETFDNLPLNHEWNFIYNPVPELWEISDEKKGIILYGNEGSLSEAVPIAWIGRRQEHHHFKAETELCFSAEQDMEEAGMTIYMNPRHHYEVALTRMEGDKCIIFRRRIGSLWKIENKISIDGDNVIFRMEADTAYYSFYYSLDKTDFRFIGKGECSYLTTEVGGAFTGNYIAMYAVGNGKKCVNGANFKWFGYTNLMSKENLLL